MSFRLTKWYGDGVSAEGVCRIGYWALLEWGGVRVRYGAVVEGGRTKWTLRAGTGPRAEGGGYRWEEPRLGVDWRWEGGEVGYTEKWMEGVEWTCLLAGARAEVGFVGAGYLEKVELRVSPWRMGLKELRWGRYVGEGETWVWVEWKGSFERTVVLRNGARVKRLEDLGLRGARVLRSGWIVGLHETKWLSRGAGGGWAVHEVVRWPK